MKKSIILALLSLSFLSCDGFKDRLDEVPKCNDSISVKLATDLVRQSIASRIMALKYRKHVTECYSLLEDYHDGATFTGKTLRQIEYATAQSDSIDITIKDILPSNINEKLKKCDCEARLIFGDRKYKMLYSAQNVDNSTYVTLMGYE